MSINDSVERNSGFKQEHILVLNPFSGDSSIKTQFCMLQRPNLYDLRVPLQPYGIAVQFVKFGHAAAQSVCLASLGQYLTGGAMTNVRIRAYYRKLSLF